MEMKSHEGYTLKLLYIGYVDEEYLFNETGKNTGWSLIGLRAETEETLRERQRDITPEDIGIDLPNWAHKWFNYEAFSDDMEEDWEDNHDVQSKFEIEDETYYLGFGLGTHIKYYFKENNIIDFKSYKNHFEEIGLNEKQFNQLYKSKFDVKILEELYNETK